MARENKEYKAIATKVSPEAYELLGRLARRHGMNVYELLQNAVSVFIRYMSDRYNLTPEMEEMMGVFEHMSGWAGALNLADPSTRKQICEATYYLCDEEGRKHGKIGIHVKTPFLGNWEQTENVGTIVERTLENLLPETYRRLRALAADNGYQSILQLLNMLISNAERGDMMRDIREGFEDCYRSDYGKPIDYGQRTRRKHSRTVVGEEYKQGTIHFEPGDVPDLPELHDDKADAHDSEPADPDDIAFG